MLNRRQLLTGLAAAIGGAVVSRVPVHAAPLSTMVWTPWYNMAGADLWQRPTPDTLALSPVWSQHLWKQPDQTAIRLCADVQGTGDVLLSWAEVGDGVTINAPAWQSLCITTILGPTGLPSYLPLAVSIRSDQGGIALRRVTILIGTPAP